MTSRRRPSEPTHAVVVPASLPIQSSDDPADRASGEGVTHTHVRPLSDQARVTLTHDDPELLFPEPAPLPKAGR